MVRPFPENGRTGHLFIGTILEERIMSEFAAVGIDLGKNVFHVVAMDV
ncbi:hypothetical protein [Ruegeria arenilitoris]|nr:hypothetical protein [Ruegeria arenilitoris]